jgi:UDP-hydrolysing UDP-N-acetyl-D-glucosamine 2-epimerase
MSAERRVAILTTGRWDAGILRSTMHALQEHAWLRPMVWAAGAHCSGRHGHTIDLLLADGIQVQRRFETLGAIDDPTADAARMLTMVDDALRVEMPSALMLVGDRSETAAAALAATLCGVPIVHLHGGEETEGAIDNALRHAITKLAHLHLVSHEVHAQRVRQMGEVSHDVIVVGPPGVDNLHRPDLPSRAELEAQLGLSLEGPVLLVTLHPTTLGGQPAHDAFEVAAALDRVDATVIITQPNPDRGADDIRAVWQRWGRGRPRTRVLEALGARRYWALLRQVAMVVGNSSSGIIEAPAAGLPSVNIGDRQAGRLRPRGVVDVPVEREAIAAAITDALRGRLPWRDDVPAYPTGAVAPRIVAALEAWRPPSPARKRFVSTACSHSS